MEPTNGRSPSATRRLPARLSGLALIAGIAASLAATTAAAQPTLDSLYRAAVAAGEKEVTVYGPPAARLRAEFAKVWGARFPDIQLEFSGMPGAKLMTKMSAEAKAGINAVDVIISGTSTVTSRLRPAGLVQPVDPFLVLPEVTEGKHWHGGRIAYADGTRMLLVMLSKLSLSTVVNKTLVKTGELTSDADLLDPKWKGRIVANDPLLQGSGYVSFRRLYDLHGEAYVTRLVKDQQVVFTSNLRQAVDWVAKGRYAIAIGPDTSVVTDYIDKGVGDLSMDHNVAWKDMMTASNGFGGLAIPASQPHPAAAKLFANWLLTQEGQYALARPLGYGSRRVDVDIEELHPAVKPRPDGEYIEAFHESFVDHPNSKKLRELVRTLTAAQ